MHITHLISSMDPAAGGPPVVVQCLAQAQAAMGHQVTIASEYAGPVNATEPTMAHRVTHSTWPRVRFPIPMRRSPLPEGINILHMHGVWEPVLLAAARTARKRGIPYIIAPHGMLDPWSLRQKRWKKRLALAFGYRAMLNRSAAIHVLNHDESDLLQSLGLTAPRAIIPNGIFLDELNPPPNPARFRAVTDGPGEQPYILFLSRLHYKKGLDYLADAFAKIAGRFPNMLLVVVGPDGGAEQPFRQQIDRLGLSHRVRLPGPLFGADKWSAIAGASAFCLPSRQEGFSVAILEALACEVPVVISTECHFPEVAEVQAGRVVSLDATEIAQSLAAVLGDPTVAKGIGQAGRKLVEERFTWPSVAARSLEIYDRLASGARIG